jgi:hypothetical protein
MLDLSGLFRVWNPAYGNWSVFGQDHLAKVLLGWDGGHAGHDAVGDAVKSMRLFNLYQHELQADPANWQQAQVPAKQGPSVQLCVPNRVQVSYCACQMGSKCPTVRAK